LADHALFKMVRNVLLRPLRPELDVSWSNIILSYLSIYFCCSTLTLEKSCEGQP
jgi:hypothetical protein